MLTTVLELLELDGDVLKDELETTDTDEELELAFVADMEALVLEEEEEADEIDEEVFWDVKNLTGTN